MYIKNKPEKARFLDKTEIILLQGHFKEFILIFYKNAIMVVVEHLSSVAFPFTATQETGKPTTRPLLSRGILQRRDKTHGVVLWQ